MVPDPLEQSLPPATAKPAAMTRPRFQITFVIVIVGTIIGAAWLIGERNGFGEIGQGGINAELLPSAGDLAPELVTFDTTGQLVRLSDFRGQPVWLNFWGSWCPPCRAEFPELQAAYSELAPQGLVMLGIAIGEDPLVAQDYADRVGGTFPVLADPGYLEALLPEDEYPEARQLVTSYTINNYPTHVFIDRDGTVRSVILSPLSYDDAIAQGTAILNSSMPAGYLPASTPASSPAD